MDLYSTVWLVISLLRSLHGNSVNWMVMLVKLTSLKVMDSLGAADNQIIMLLTSVMHHYQYQQLLLPLSILQC